MPEFQAYFLNRVRAYTKSAILLIINDPDNNFTEQGTNQQRQSPGEMLIGWMENSSLKTEQGRCFHLRKMNRLRRNQNQTYLYAACCFHKRKNALQGTGPQCTLGAELISSQVVALVFCAPAALSCRNVLHHHKISMQGQTKCAFASIDSGYQTSCQALLCSGQQCLVAASVPQMTVWGLVSSGKGVFHLCCHPKAGLQQKIFPTRLKSKTQKSTCSGHAHLHLAAVVNYRVPMPETKQEVVLPKDASSHQTSLYMQCRSSSDLPTLFFVSTLGTFYVRIWKGIFGANAATNDASHEYFALLQGFHPTKWRDLTTTLDGPEVQVFKEACKRNKVYGIFSITGEQHPDASKNPYNTLIMITDKGDINLASAYDL
eukprot:1160445-Pelagomonas_calceolata.AAC.12